jgi:hypothetical protein
MSKSKLFFALTVIMALAVSFSGCGGDDSGTVSPPAATTQKPPAGTTAPATTPAPTTPPPPTTPAADVILKAMNNASAAMNTYQSKMQTSMSMSFLGTTMKLDMSTSAVADVPGKKLFMDNTIVTTGAGATSMTQQMYIINDTLYMKINSAESGLDPNTWYKELMPAADQQAMWTSQDVGDQFQILLDAAVLQVVGTETVNGVQCYKLKITPNIDKFMAYLAASGSDLADMGIANPAQAFKQLDVTFWVDKSSYIPAKMDMAIGIDAQGMNITMTMAMTFEKVNQPVDITLPPAALAAVTIAP